MSKRSIRKRRHRKPKAQLVPFSSFTLTIDGVEYARGRVGGHSRESGGACSRTYTAEMSVEHVFRPTGEED